MSFNHDRRKTDTQLAPPEPRDSATWPSALRRFESQILELVEVWAYPSGNAWLLHDDGTIIEIPNSDPMPSVANDGLETMRHAHTRASLVGQWSIVVGGINKQDIGRFNNAVQMLARLARQQGELEATSSVALEMSEEVAALQQLVSLPIKSLEHSAVFNHLAENALTITRSAAAVLIDEDGSTFVAGTTDEVDLPLHLASEQISNSVARSENASTPCDYVVKKIVDGTVTIAITGWHGADITATQLRHFDDIAKHADGLLRLVQLSKVSA